MELLSLKVAKHNCYFFLTAFKNEQRLCPPGYFHITADIETKCEGISVIIARCFPSSK